MWEAIKAVWDQIGPLVGVIVGGGIAFVMSRVQAGQKEERELERRKEVLAQARSDVLNILAMQEKLMNSAAGAFFDLVHLLKQADTLAEIEKSALDKER